MPDTAVNRRRGTTAQHAAFTGIIGETTYDTDLQRLVTHDGATVGGFPAAMLHVANVFTKLQTISLPTAALANAFDIQVNSISRLLVRNDGFSFFTRQEADDSLSGISLDKRGTVGNDSAALIAGGGLGQVQFRGWDGAAFGSGGSVRMFTSEAWTGIAHGTKLFFQTVPIGSITTTTHATLDSTALEVMSRLLLPNTTSATVGGIYFGGIRAVHNFGTTNFFAGVGAGNLTLSGADNTGIGINALAALTSGARNVAVGDDAMAAVTIATNNVAVGSNAMLLTTSGGSNIAMGRNALQTNLIGTHNTALGTSALNLATGVDNTAVGSNSLVSLTTGLRNTAVGRQALNGNSTGSDNVAIGTFALFAASTSSFNTGVGTGALQFSSGANNTVVGFAAGSTVLGTTGSNNIAFGYQAGNNLTTGSNNIVIGYDIDSPTATNSNTLTLGNIIFGTGIDGTGTTISSGNVGIAVITPTSGLHLGRSFAAPYRATAVTTTFLSSDHTIDATSGTFTVNLPTAVGITGRIYVAKNSGVGTITLDPAGAELIDGLATATIVAGASITTQSTGAGWIII